ncbi:hypothetical protein [Bradyrhizobium sp. RDM4]|uniref:hypothetical protein n=1 Tax=Bradyrhizobium sp. RDM4 TaxID=3378765 RepID=UPI0038FCF5E1
MSRTNFANDDGLLDQPRSMTRCQPGHVPVVSWSAAGNAIRQNGIQAKKSGKKKSGATAPSSAVEGGAWPAVLHETRLWTLKVLKSMIVADISYLLLLCCSQP